MPVWNHQFDWEYRTPLKAPWYSGLAQGQGISLLVRVARETGRSEYIEAATRAFVSFSKPIEEGGVVFTDDAGDIWFEEYIVSPPTHILNGFIWAAWGVHDFFLATRRKLPSSCSAVRSTTLRRNLDRYDMGFWWLYELSGTRLPMVASPFYHQLHVAQLRLMYRLLATKCFPDTPTAGRRMPAAGPNGLGLVLQGRFQALLLLGTREDPLRLTVFSAGDGGARRSRGGIVTLLGARRHEVTVLTGFPNHPTGVVPAEYRRKILHGWWRGKIERSRRRPDLAVAVSQSQDLQAHLELQLVLRFAAGTGLFTERPDVVIASRPNAWSDCRDGGWPGASGHVSSSRFATCGRSPGGCRRGKHGINGVSHTGPDCRISLPELRPHSRRNACIQGNLVEHWRSGQRRFRWWRTGLRRSYSVRRRKAACGPRLGADGRFVVSYIGTMGNAHGLQTLVEAAAQLQNSAPRVLFLLVGEGAEKEQLVSLVRSRGCHQSALCGSAIAGKDTRPTFAPRTHVWSCSRG